MEVIYITPNGTEISELKLRERYGDEKFEMFLAEGKLKKKDASELPLEDGSLESQEKVSPNNLEVLQKDFVFPEPTQEPQQTNVVNQIPEVLAEEEVVVTPEETIMQREFLEGKGVDVDAMLREKKFGNKQTSGSEAADIASEYNMFLTTNASQNITSDLSSSKLKPIERVLEDDQEIRPATVNKFILKQLNIDEDDYAAWEQNTQREESTFYKGVKKIVPLLTGVSGALSLTEDQETYQKEKKDTEKLLSYKMEVMENLKQDIYTIDSRLQLAKSPEDKIQLLNIKTQLEAKLIEETNLLSKMETLFPTYKKLTSDLDLKRRTAVYEAGQSGTSQEVLSTVIETAKTIPTTITNFVLGTAASVTALLDQGLTAAGADKKGVLAGVTEGLLNATEAVEKEIGSVSRSSIQEGKRITVNSKEYFVNEEGEVLDFKTFVNMQGIISKDQIKLIKERAKNIKYTEYESDPGAGLQSLSQTVVNLFALIRGGQGFSKALGVSPAVGMGVASYASTMAQSVEDMRADLVAAGETEDQALNKSTIAGNAIATLDAVFSSLAGSNTKVLGSLTGFKTAVINAVKTNGKSFSSQQLKSKIRELGKENFKEVFIEELPVLFSEKGINAIVNYATNKNVRSSKIKATDIIETVVLTIGATSGLGSRGLLKGNKRSDALKFVAQNDSDIKGTVEGLVNNNDITAEEGKSVYDEIYSMQVAENKTKGTIVNSDNMLEASDLLNQRQRLMDQKEGLEGPLKEDIDKQIADIDEQISAVKEKDNAQSREEVKGETIIEKEPTIEDARKRLDVENEIRAKSNLPALQATENQLEETRQELIKEQELRNKRNNITEQKTEDTQDKINQKEESLEEKKDVIVKEEQKETDQITLNDSAQRMELVKESKKSPDTVRTKLTKVIKKYLPKGNTYTQGVVNRLSKLVANVETEQEFESAVNKVMDEVDKQVTKQKTSTLKKILKLVKSKAKGRRTVSGRKSNKGLDSQGQSFFNSIQRIVTAAINQDIDAMAEISNELSDLDVIDEILIKESELKPGEKLEVSEEKILNQVLAFDTLGDIANMSLEEVNTVLESLKDVRKESIIRFKENRQKRVDEKKKLQDEAGRAVEERNPELINEDGKAKNKNELEQDRLKIAAEYEKKGILKKLGVTIDNLRKNILDAGSKGFNAFIANLASVTKSMDTSNSSFFYDNIYKRLARQDEVYNKGIVTQNKKIKELKESIEGFNKDTLLGEVKIEGIKNREGTVTSKEQALRFYALYQNPVQKNKLQQQGFTDAKIESIKKQLGSAAITYADNVIEYLGTEYYNSINKIYEKNNDIKLTQVENYFPVETLSQREASDIITGKGGFSQVFNQTTLSALKERTDTKGEIDLTPGFSTVLENHLGSMEKYKAYADVVVFLNNLFNSKKVDALIGTLGVKSIIEKIINAQINPSSISRAFSVAGGTTRFASTFTKYALSYKLIQIVKQASSFITAFESYKFKPKSNVLQDATMFMVDAAKLALRLPKILYTKDNPINKAMDMSASFRRRIEQGLEGDVYGLESGSETLTQIKNPSKIRKAWNSFVKFGTYPTIIGDVLGVMGYMVNYERDIKNGMSEAEALEKFNDYNQSQQSRRAIDKSGIQLPGDKDLSQLSRGFTMFGSTLFLYMNKVAQTSKSITRDILEGGPQNVKSKDVKGLMIYYGVANGLFAALSNIAKVIGLGDEEDKDEAYQSIKEAMQGLPLLYQIPIFGEAIEVMIQTYQKNKVSALKEELKNLKGPFKSRRAKEIKAEIKTYPSRYYSTGQFLNPLVALMTKTIKNINDGLQYKDALSVLEAVGGVQTDPFVGLYNVARGLMGKEDDEDFDFEDSTYDLLGIAPSYRPKNKIKEKEDKEKAKPFTLKQQKVFKERNPKRWKELYGPGSKYYENKKENARRKKERQNN